MMNETLKNVWPEWQIEKQIGRGSYGTVYKAVRRDSNVESYAAIKIISIPSDSSEVDSMRSEGLDMDGTRTYFKGIVDDFVNEIQLMQTLKGIQNIVSVEDYKVVEKTDEIGWDIYIRMELLTPFNSYICDRKLTEDEVIKLGCDICTALEICGKKNIIHRDIKPENIFINDFGDYKLGDFGIARKLENTTGGLSQKGTFNYMAPEVANSASYDAKVDTYSLGIVLYRLLNENRLPFLDSEKQLLSPSDRKAAVERRIHGEPLTAPCEASPEMANLILHACAFDPDQRFASASEMKQALLAVQNGTYRAVTIDTDKTVSVRKAQPAEQEEAGVKTFGEEPRKKKKKGASIIAALLTVAILLGAGWYFLPELLGKDGDPVSESDSDYSRSDRKQISSIIADADALADTEAYEDAIETIRDGMVTYPDSVSLKNKLDEYTQSLETQQINAILADAESYAEGEYYEDAIKRLEAGLKAHPDSKELQDRQDEYNALLSAQIKAKNLEDAKKLSDSGDYKAAMELIQAAIKKYGEDADYKKAYDTYNKQYLAKVKDDAVAEADALAKSGDYLGAYQAISEALKIVKDDVALSAKASEYEKQYVDAVLTQADGHMSEKRFSDAENALNTALKQFPDNASLKDKLAEVKERKPVPLTTLTMINSGNSGMNEANWNKGAPVDPFGNDYSTTSNFCIFESYSNTGNSYTEYRAYGKYKTITGNLAPYTSISENGTIHIQIYADNDLVYTSPEITRKTDMFSFSVDIGNAEYIKLVVSKSGPKAALIISDVLLWAD